MSEAAPDPFLKLTARGRGAISNLSGRFESYQREAFDDGWLEGEAPPPLRTTVSADHARTVISRNDSPDIAFDQSINPYRGCEHGCIYCYARPAHAYMGLSPGLDFESRLFFKREAGARLAEELSHPRYRPKVIHVGGNTDPYQPVERRLRVTRSVIEILWAFRHPFSIITKSALILRDLDILRPLAEARLVRVAISVTTLDRTLARDMEPRAATPERRLLAIRRLSEAGIPVMVMFAPVIPGLNDFEMEAVLERAAKAGAVGAGYITLRLPREVEPLFVEWLRSERPDRAARALSLMRQIHGGRLKDPRFGHRMHGQGPLADLLAQRFALARGRTGLDAARPPLDLSQFRPHALSRQGDLFG